MDLVVILVYWARKDFFPDPPGPNLYWMQVMFLGLVKGELDVSILIRLFRIIRTNLIVRVSSLYSMYQII